MAIVYGAGFAGAEAYLPTLRAYPRALDVALPVFSWGIHLRGNQVVGLLNKTDEASSTSAESWDYDESKKPSVVKPQTITGAEKRNLLREDQSNCPAKHPVLPRPRLYRWSCLQVQELRHLQLFIRHRIREMSAPAHGGDLQLSPHGASRLPGCPPHGPNCRRKNCALVTVKIADCHDCDHAVAQKVKYTKETFLGKMKEMQAHIDKKRRRLQ